MALAWNGTAAKRGAALLAGAAVLAGGGCAQVSGMETQARILSEPPCTDFFFPVYFAGGSVEPPAAARSVIRSAGKHAEGCQVTKVEVTGLPDPAAPAGGGTLALLHERARNLGAALQGAGLPRPEFHLSALGAAAPAPAKPPRRVDVYVRFQR